MNLKDMPLKAKIIMIVCMIIVVIISIILFIPKNDKVIDDNTEKSLVNPNKEKINEEFVDIGYTRTTNNATEYIKFNSDGTFSYSYENGNAVDNYDLCEYYTVKNSLIEFVCYEEPGIIRQIIISEVYKDKLVLDFGGESREFHKEVESE